MPYDWPEDTDFALWELDVLDRDCPACGRMMHICDHRYRRFHTLDGPVQLVCKLNHCPDPDCPGHAKTKSPETRSHHRPAQVGDRLGRLLLDRASTLFAPHGDPPDPIRTPRRLRDQALRRCHRPVHPTLPGHARGTAARPRGRSAGTTKAVDEIILSIDGLQPEKGHETLYVVRELTRKRVWFAEPLLSATADEVRRLIAKAKEWAESLGKPVALWISDKQDAFVTGIAAEFPDVPHRYCDNHFLRDLAKPVLEADSHAKVQMRKKVRGLRTIEQAVLAAAEGRDRGTTSRPRLRKPPSRRPRRRTCLLPWSIPPAPWSSTIARRCAGSSTTIRGGRCILPGCGWPRR